MPWRPRTRGETLLPSREEVKEEEEGGSLPLSPGDNDLHQQLHHRHQLLFPPSMQQCNPSLTRCDLYLNMVLNAIYYFPMMYGYPMMFE